MTDREFEIFLKKAVEEAAARDCAETEAKSRNFFYKPSAEFEKTSGRTVGSPAKKKIVLKKRGKLCVLAAAIIILLCGGVLASETELWKNHLVIKDIEGGVSVTYDGENKNSEAENSSGETTKSEEKTKVSEIDFSVPGIYRVTWIPKGYQRTDESNPDENNPYWHTETFENEETGELISYSQMTNDYELTMSFDEESGVRKSIEICGVQGKYIADKEKKHIIYEVNGVIYQIHGNVSKHKLVKMLESRVRVE